MREPKFTNTQWIAGHLSNDNHSCNCCYILCGNYMGAVADVCWSDKSKPREDGNEPDGDNPPLEEAKANQKLIAVSPEMWHLLNSELLQRIAERSMYDSSCQGKDIADFAAQAEEILAKTD